jgi:type VI protein secretion system component Hcp
MKISRLFCVVVLVALALVVPARSQTVNSEKLYVSGTVTDVITFTFGASSGGGSPTTIDVLIPSDSPSVPLLYSYLVSGKPIRTVTLDLYEITAGVSALVETVQLGEVRVSSFQTSLSNTRAVTFSFRTITYTTPATCSVASLNSVYGFINTGYETAPTIHPSVSVGQITYDGKGNVSGAVTHSNGGTISTLTFTGTYSVSNDCTGSTVETQSDGNIIHNSFVIGRNKGTQFIRTDPTQTRTGFSLAQGGAACGVTGVPETFAVNLIGSGTGANPVAYVGQATLDGEGNVFGSGTLSVDGAIISGPLSGTYTENAANCTGTMQLTPFGGTPANFNFVVVSAGRELLMIETDSGTTVSGTAQE